MMPYCQYNGGEEAVVRDMVATYDGGNYHPFACAQQAVNFSQYPVNWTADLTRAYLHGMPASESFMHNGLPSATSHRSAHSPSVPQDHLQPQHSMKRPTFSQKLRRLRSLQIPGGRPLPSTEQPVFQSATSQATSSITTSGLQCFEGSSQAADCSGDLTDGMSYHSNTSWTSPSMTIADSISPASSLQLKHAPRSAQDYQPAFSSVNSPLTAQDVQQPGWISYSPAFPGDGQNTSTAELTSHNAFGTSYQAFPSTFEAVNIGLPYAQTDMSSTTSWFAGNDVADSWLYNTFQPTPEMCWAQGAPAASGDLVCNVNTQPEFITPTQLVSHSSPVATISSVRSSPSVQTASAVRAPSIQHDDNDPFDDGRKTLHSISEERRRKDSILLKLRRQGLSYKEIKRRTGRTEAESTLRGQVRALSKPPQHRVRKPVWTRGDELLLQDAIHRYHDPTSPAPKKRTRRGGRQVEDTFRPPWQKVAEYVSANGGSYPFSASACSKKWLEVAGSLHRADR